MTDRVENKKGKRIKKIALIFIAIILAVVALVYGMILYYDYFVLPSEIDNGIDITKSQLYIDHRSDIIKRSEAKLKGAETEYDRLLAIEDLAVFLIDEGKIEEAGTFAKQILEIAPKYQNSWNYGNAVHKAHISLGRIELRSNNIEGAKQHLLEAGRTPGSPQLDSFGPKMLLAKELLERGEKDVVLQYIELCSKFWDTGDAEMRIWKEVIKKGRIPDFKSHLL